METTHVEPYRRLKGRARGELQGTGCWTFDAAGGVTTVRYDWNVHTTPVWMNLLAPLAHLLANAAEIGQREQQVNNN